MSNYTKLTAYDTKDSLTTGDPLKRVKGTELDDEFDAISVAIATKANLASPEFTGTPTVPTASVGVSTTQAASTAFVQAALAAIYPVGSVYINATSAVNPATLLGFGTWSAYSAGRVLVGLNAGNALFDTAEETGGSADAITVSHTHTFSATTGNTDVSHTHQYGSSAGSGAGGTAAYDARNNGSFTTSTPNVSLSHSHSVSGTTASTGASGTNANYPPYITVYMWKRTA
jgi:hypothetical protein